MGIKSRAKQNQIWLMVCRDPFDFLSEPVAIGRTTCPHGQRNIAGRSQPRSGSSFLGPAGPRVEGPAVNREKRDLRITPENILSPVSVMHIPVDDQHAIDSGIRMRVCGRDGHVIEQTESHRAVGERMVPRGTYQAECALRFPFDDP